MGPLFKWFGSKWSSSRLLPPPRHRLLIEPFAGSAGYALRYADRKVVLAESNALLNELWRWLIDEANKKLIQEIPCNLPPGTDIRTLGLSRGQALLMKHWQYTNNLSDCWTVSPWTDVNFSEGIRWRVANTVSRIKHWKLYDNATNLFLAYMDEEHVTWFVDPPYQYNYKYSTAEIDYKTLGEWITRRLRGQRIVCEAVCPKTGDVPKWLNFQPWKERVTSRRKKGNNNYSKELIWYNYQEPCVKCG